MARGRTHLPVVDNLQIASPCPVPWSTMVGNDRSRFCRDCNKSVFNISGMSRAEAEALIVERAGNLCVTYYQRADGTILLADCTTRRNRTRSVLTSVVFASLAACGGPSQPMALDDLAISPGETEHIASPAERIAASGDPAPPPPGARRGPRAVPPPTAVSLKKRLQAKLLARQKHGWLQFTGIPRQ